MKLSCLSIFFIFYSWACVAQNKDMRNLQNPNFQREEKKIQSQAEHIASRNRLLNSEPISLTQLSNPDSLKHFIENASKVKGISISKTFPGQQAVNNSCRDTSFIRMLSTYASRINVSNVVPAADGSTFITGFMYDTTLLPHYSWRDFPLLLKVDSSGNLVWLKRFDDIIDPGPYRSFFFTDVFELSNHDLVAVGGIDTTGGGSRNKTFISRLTSNGDLIWQTVYKTNLPSVGNGGIVGLFSFYVNSLAEGLNGDLILGGTTRANNSGDKCETILRITGTGNLLWDANYGNESSGLEGTELTGVYFQNGQILATGVSQGIVLSFDVALTFITLDYNTGNLLNKKFFKAQYSDPLELYGKSFMGYSNNCTRLTNGHFLCYGKLWSGYFNTDPIISHFGVVEFDENLNLADSYIIGSKLITDYFRNILYLDHSGKGLVSLFNVIDANNSNVYFSSFNNRQVQNERRVRFNNMWVYSVFSGANGFQFSADGGYVYVQSRVENNGTKSYIEFRKMHNSDSSSECMGIDTSFLHFLPYNIISDPAYPYLDPNIPGMLELLHYNISQTDTMVVHVTDPCRLTSSCDTIKIHGNGAICGSQSAVVFTTYKNPGCGASVQWSIDPAGIDSLKIQTDSSVIVYFQNQNWQGQLYASIPGGPCSAAIIDSITVHVVNIQSQVNLGPDTILCANNSMILHAGNSFSNYLWQDASTDSTLTITSPGTYYVTASDPCGNVFSDTVVVSAANFPFSIGNDTIRCNNDSIHLSATVGFINYAWLTQYNISATIGQSVSVFPLTDTAYIAVAEKWPGCFVRDTIHISVLHSAAIHFGNDTSICTGQSIILDAGSGFATYAWSNGTNGQQLTTSQTGTYFVAATAANGCVSKDTLKILQVSALPVFTLGVDTSLCDQAIYSYHFNLSNASYLWNDGNTSTDYTISQSGTYWLAVTQAGCTGRDTVEITYKPNPTVMLGHDTTICHGSSYLLNASYNNATYLWQDGSILPQFTVTGPGTYFVKISLAGCTASDSIQISYRDKPFFNLGADTSICPAQTILLEPAINTTVDYLWQDGSNLPSFTVITAGLYKLQVSNDCGTYKDSVIITNGTCLLELPNAFTPNGDGVNDIFRVKFPFPVREFRFAVYNRYGQELFVTNNMGSGWDGSFRGKPQGVGTYVWMVQMVNTYGVREMRTGNIILAR